MDDIVTLLRKYQPYSKLHGQAADEIERLRKLGDTMAYFVRSGDGKEMYSAVYAWEEARRG